jgi:DAK2 domain fusion protein YloV
LPEVRDTLDAAAVRAWCAAATTALRAAQEEIDALNVYPVPDGDTGTNLFLTMRAVAEAVEAVPDDLDVFATLRALSRGALMGARGNSGVILSQVLRGCVDVFIETLEAGDLLDGPTLHAAYERGAKLAYQAVAQPVEGTILTVARAAAEGSAAGGSLLTVARAAADSANEALARTPEQLSVLAAAGVVDAGGRGLVVLLDAFASVLSGEYSSRAAPPGLPAPVVDRTALADAREQGSDEFAFEVMYLLDAEDAAIPGLRDKLSSLGDSLVVVGGDGLWNVHVHINDVGAAIEAGVVAGRPHRIAVTNFATQVAAQQRGGAPSTGRAIVALTPGGGLARLYAEAGAVVAEGLPLRQPTSDDILDVVRRCGAREVVVLPNDESAHDAAEDAAARARAEGLTVAVVPTRASVQGIAALAVHDPDRAFDESVIAMTGAARATRHGEVTIAEEEALTTAGVCRPGDVLGFLEGDVAVIGQSVMTVGTELLDRLLIGGGELVTLVTGDAAENVGETLSDYLHNIRPDVEAVVYPGGQPQYPLLIGVE